MSKFVDLAMREFLIDSIIYEKDKKYIPLSQAQDYLFGIMRAKDLSSDEKEFMSDKLNISNNSISVGFRSKHVRWGGICKELFDSKGVEQDIKDELVSSVADFIKNNTDDVRMESNCASVPKINLKGQIRGPGTDFSTISVPSDYVL